MLLFIVGYMGAGKSGIGREAARRAGVRFVDTDKEVEELHGATVSEIFARDGEAAFRKSEREVIERLVAEGGNAIVATGGGLPCEGDAMKLMNAAGRTVYLRLSSAKLVPRLRHGQSRRPKLDGLDEKGLLEYIERTLPIREECYMQATMIIDCDTLSDESVTAYVAMFAMAGAPQGD
jgi:shikimate kinase